MESLHEPSQRRNSFRRSLSDCGLSAEYLEQLEAKRKALDDSIHRFIASKEREYQAYEKELRHQVKTRSSDRSAGQHNGETETARDATSTPAIDALLWSGTSKKLHDNTAEIDFGLHDGTSHPKRKKEEFPGVFIPEYIAALEYPIPERTTSAPPSGAAGVPTVVPIMRTNSDSAAARASHPARLSLNQRTSSSGSSVDGRLISALKSSSEASRSRKRVSLAVGDSIVKPSDNVPAPLKANSTASHSRVQPPARQSLLDVSSSVSPPDGDTRSTNGTSSAVQKLQESGSASAASLTDTRRGAAPSPRQQDIGDMFDLVEDEVNAAFEEMSDTSPEDYFDNEIAGREHYKELQQDLDADTGEPPPPPLADDDDDLVPSEPLIFADGAAATKQPASPGFRRPSAAIDPIYTGRDYPVVEDATAADGSSFYGSSYNRSSKGSFTSSSLGESYMARNAEKLMAARAQHQQPRQTTAVMPV